MPASDWVNIPDFTLADSKTWKSKIKSADSTVDFKHVAETPSELMLDPEDFEIIPEEVQSDNDDWAIVTLVSNDETLWTKLTDENF